MDDRKLEVMLTVLRTGSFGKAALALNCSQPAVTQMIGSMEKELGCKLFHRGRSGVQLTPAGETLLPFIVEADAAHARLTQQARAIAQGAAIPIRIAAFASLFNTWLPNAIKDYQRDHPDVTFDIRIGTNEIPDWLRFEEVDIVLADERRCAGFRWHPLLDDPYVAVLPQGLVGDEVRVIHQEELLQQPFIMASLDELDLGNTLRPARCMKVKSDDNNTLLLMVAQGLGVSAMPRLSLQNLPANVRVLELQPALKRVLGIALSHSPGKAAKDFAAFLRRRVHYEEGLKEQKR